MKYFNNRMEIGPFKTIVTTKDLATKYVNDTGVYAYNGLLCVRPEFQRAFVYTPEQSSAVIETMLLNRPLGDMYWVHNQNETYDTLDGQQRTISACNFAIGELSAKIKDFNDNRPFNIFFLEHNYPKLAEIFWNYQFQIKLCEHGSKEEILDWFRTINIQGEKLTDQELRNINYTGLWLTDAKQYFSTTTAQAKSKAQQLADNYVSKKAYRQELLEQVLAWIADSKSDAAICDYMEEHYHDADAHELWDYFNKVITWVQDIFPTLEEKYSKSIEWGLLYNKYHTNQYDVDKINDTFNELILAKANGELLSGTSTAHIIEYCLSNNEKLLNPRKFNDAQKTAMYKRQHGCCAICGKPFDLKDLQAHHIISYRAGGLTSIDNGQLLCQNCHENEHFS